MKRVEIGCWLCIRTDASQVWSLSVYWVWILQMNGSISSLKVSPWKDQSGLSVILMHPLMWSVSGFAWKSGRTQRKKTRVLSLTIACLLWQYMLYDYILLLCTLQCDCLPNVCTVRPNLLLHVQALMFQGCSFCLESCHNTGYVISVSEEIFYSMSVVILCCVTVIVSFKWC